MPVVMVDLNWPEIGFPEVYICFRAQAGTARAARVAITVMNDAHCLIRAAITISAVNMMDPHQRQHLYSRSLTANYSSDAPNATDYIP
jgi:hypothetical protein